MMSLPAPPKSGAQTALHEVEQSAVRHRLTRLEAKVEEMQGLVGERQVDEQEPLESVPGTGQYRAVVILLPASQPAS